VRGLKPARCDGYAGLSTDYIINACDELYVPIALLFSAMTVHGIVFDDLLVSSIISYQFRKLRTSIILSQPIMGHSA